VKYTPRHPVFNFICAALCFLSGCAFIVVALLPVNEQQFWHNPGFGMDSTSAYLSCFGLLWAALGGAGVVWHFQYFRKRRKTKNDKC
jgi:hypothetical protein